MVTAGAGDDLDAERQPVRVEPEWDLGDRQRGEVEDDDRGDREGSQQDPVVAGRDARVRRMEEDAVADELGDLAGKGAAGGERAPVERLRLEPCEPLERMRAS